MKSFFRGLFPYVCLMAAIALAADGKICIPILLLFLAFIGFMEVF